MAVYHKSFQEHLEGLEVVLKRVINAQLHISLEKTRLFAREVDLLGHRVGYGLAKPNLDKTKAIREYPIPNSKKEVQAFLGLSAYYRRFVMNYAKIARPLHKLLCKDTEFQWGDEQQEAFDSLRERLTTEPVLQAPDSKQDWYIFTDASKDCIGRVWTQLTEANAKSNYMPVCYYSRALRGSEVNYPMVEKALSVIEALKKYRPLIYNSRVVIFTDNKALCWLFERSHDRNARISKWVLSLQEANVEVKFIQGEKNVVADKLNRIKFDITNTTWASTQFEVDPLAVCSLEELCNSKIELLGNIQVAQTTEGEEPEERGWTPEELRELQATDTLYGPAVKYLQSCEPNDLDKIDPKVKRDVSNYFLHDNILYKRQIARDASLRGMEEVLVFQGH